MLGAKNPTYDAGPSLSPPGRQLSSKKKNGSNRLARRRADGAPTAATSWLFPSFAYGAPTAALFIHSSLREKLQDICEGDRRFRSLKRTE